MTGSKDDSEDYQSRFVQPYLDGPHIIYLHTSRPSGDCMGHSSDSSAPFVYTPAILRHDCILYTYTPTGPRVTAWATAVSAPFVYTPAILRHDCILYTCTPTGPRVTAWATAVSARFVYTPAILKHDCILYTYTPTGPRVTAWATAVSARFVSSGNQQQKL